MVVTGVVAEEDVLGLGRSPLLHPPLEGSQLAMVVLTGVLELQSRQQCLCGCVGLRLEPLLAIATKRGKAIFVVSQLRRRGSRMSAFAAGRRAGGGERWAVDCATRQQLAGFTGLAEAATDRTDVRLPRL